MMKVSKERAAENRTRILSAAARLFREQGIAATGVDSLMDAAGLTHGSLYSQFGSKESLVAASLEAGWESAKSRSPALTQLSQALAIYLSPEHRDHSGQGCFMAALGSETARQSRKVRRSFTGIVEDNIARIARLLGSSGRRGQDQAVYTVAAMVGALMLARAVDDPELSDRFLAVTRKRLVAERP